MNVDLDEMMADLKKYVSEDKALKVLQELREAIGIGAEKSEYTKAEVKQLKKWVKKGVDLNVLFYKNKCEGDKHLLEVAINKGVIGKAIILVIEEEEEGTKK